MSINDRIKLVIQKNIFTPCRWFFGLSILIFQKRSFQHFYVTHFKQHGRVFIPSRNFFISEIFTKKRSLIWIWLFSLNQDFLSIWNSFMMIVFSLTHWRKTYFHFDISVAVIRNFQLVRTWGKFNNFIGLQIGEQLMQIGIDIVLMLAVI